MRFVTLKSAFCAAAVFAACAFTAPVSATTSFQFNGSIDESYIGGMPVGTEFMAWGLYDETKVGLDGKYSFADNGGVFFLQILGTVFHKEDDDRWGLGGGPILSFDETDALDRFNFEMSGSDILGIGGTYLGAFGLLGFENDFGDFASGTYALTKQSYLPPNPDPTGGIPEPATWLMLVVGFGLAGAAWRRRMLLAKAA
ncbi:PEPxxWA-CTERM sorting domain-containing protein [Pseudokordiimonas caeni]|uniref:PEPxxWA-CTERM sorting domain-containing protein n=1 Tax=Pseudokordiimonas caeni TaxID=2997908 RepID=UPI00281223CF|nr:PEPxxWA-CTERM sorting domain-containing protein [Pseudokordiimonas caeni]